MATITFQYKVPNDNKALNGTGTSLNLGSAFTTTGSGRVGRITAVTCKYAVMAPTHRSGAQFQVTLSNTNTSSSYTSNVITAGLTSNNGHSAIITNTWDILPNSVIFNDPSNTTVQIQQIADVNSTYLAYSDSVALYVTITVTYEDGSLPYVYTDNGWVEGVPYVYTDSGWVQGTIMAHNGTSFI